MIGELFLKTQIRDFDPSTDYPLITKLLNTFYNEPRSVESVKEASSHYPHGTVSIRKIVEVDSNGVGMLRITRLGNADFLWFIIIIDPVFRGRGIGTILYKEGEKFVEELEAKLLYCQVFDHMSDSISFAEKNGFIVDRHIYDSKLMITRDTPGLDYSLLKQAEEKGFIFCSMSDLQDVPDAREKLHALYLITSNDIPGWSEPPPTFDEFCNSVFRHSGYKPEAQFIVMKDSEWVGMSTLIYSKESNSLYTSMTGIDRRYRGNGLAQILKMLTIQYATDTNISYMLTHNDSKNHAMIAINQKLGYQPQPGYYQMVKRLG
jgi:RimJ/RimL family protein N-acetyltransferase